jgi:hypothetical protein
MVDDSERTIEYLKRNYQISLDSWLAPSQTCDGSRRAADARKWHLQGCGIQRWVEDKNLTPLQAGGISRGTDPIATYHGSVTAARI